MEKKRFGPKLKMEGLPKASKAKVKFLTLPKQIETSFDTGFGKSGKVKWEIDIDLLDHPEQKILGKMVWQTVAIVIRIEIAQLIDMSNKKDLENLERDWMGCEWFICVDETGQTSIEEV